MKKYNITGQTATYRATYKAGKLQRIEHISGKNTSNAWAYLMRTIPHTEEHLHNHADIFPNLKVEPVQAKTTSLYKHYVADWFYFFHKLNGVEPKFTATDGRALKSIIKYLESISPTPQQARNTWQALLMQWHLLPPFHKSKTDIVYINAKLNELITLLKNVNHEEEKARNIRDAI